MCVREREREREREKKEEEEEEKEEEEIILIIHKVPELINANHIYIELDKNWSTKIYTLHSLSISLSHTHTQTHTHIHKGTVSLQVL
jgi:hypothetical protein